MEDMSMLVSVPILSSCFTNQEYFCAGLSLAGEEGQSVSSGGGEPQGKWLKIRFRPRISHTLLILHMSFYIPPSPPSRGQILETVLLLRSNLSGLYLKEMVNVNQSTYQFATGMLPSINIGFDLIQS